MKGDSKDRDKMRADMQHIVGTTQDEPEKADEDYIQRGSFDRLCSEQWTGVGVINAEPPRVLGAGLTSPSPPSPDRVELTTSMVV